MFSEKSFPASVACRYIANKHLVINAYIINTAAQIYTVCHSDNDYYCVSVRICTATSPHSIVHI